MNPNSSSAYGGEAIEVNDAFYGSGGGNNFYDPMTGGSGQMFDDPSVSGGPFGPPNPVPGFSSGPFIPSSPPGMNMFNPMASSPFDPVASGMNPNLLYSAGSQMLASQASSVFNQYAQDFEQKGKSWIGNTLKYYFAVDTSYVFRKLLLLLMPFTHKDWSVRFNADEAVAPRDDINAPDLYIPCMAYVTYILVSGFLIATSGDFGPERLGVQATSALVWIISQVVLLWLALNVVGVKCGLTIFHLLAFSSYKFVPIILCLLVSYFLNSSTAYYACLAYTSLSLAFFIMRSLHVTIQTTSVGHFSPQHSMFLVLLDCVVEVGIMWWLTRHLILMPAV